MALTVTFLDLPEPSPALSSMTASPPLLPIMSSNLQPQLLNISDVESRTPTRNHKTFYSTSNPYEHSFGYHRAVRRGPFIFVSGTTALDPSTGKLQHPGNAFLQACTAIEESLTAIRALGGRGAEDVVRVRMFVGGSEYCDEVGRAFHATFGGHKLGVGVAATMLVIRDGFVMDGMLVEIEVEGMVE